MSPRKKKPKLASVTSSPSTSKREAEETDKIRKRLKSDVKPDEDIQAKKRKNFITACERVSFKSYFDNYRRFQLVYLPACARSTTCIHQDYKNGAQIKQMPSYAEESFKIEMKTNMWCEALEVCFLSITTDRYLSANVLKDIVEIMMNAHEDNYAEYTIEYLLDKCQTLLSQSFSTHAPCLVKTIRKCYNNFLTSPLDLKENTFTNRTLFDCDKGLVKYCMNRLEYEISIDSKDEPLVDKYEHIPEEMKQSVKGLHWQKEKLEIFELLERKDRIDRLMRVLESIIELLQFDLAIWHSRYTHNLGCHIMRSHKPLMAYILWSNNVLYTGAVNNNCRQILRLFVYMVHLRYPVDFVRIMGNWLNTIVQTFYICENNSNSDYPNTGKYCTTFAVEFYKIISEMPHDSVIRILEMIQPKYMQYLIGKMHVKKLLATEVDDIIKNLIDFVQKSQWQLYAENSEPILISETIYIRPKKCKNLMNRVTKNLENLNLANNSPSENSYPKFDPKLIGSRSIFNVNHVVHSLYVTFESYLDAFSVQDVQETLDNLNKQLSQSNANDIEVNIPEYCSYTVTENFIKTYRSIFQKLKDLMVILHKLRSTGKFPDVLKVFEKIGLLDL